METYAGQLDVDHERGVISFQSYTGEVLLRIYGLPKPIPHVAYKAGDTWELSHCTANWEGEAND